METLREEVEIEAGPTRLPGELSLQPDNRGLVIFAHGSGSSRLSPRNIEVSNALNEAGLATLLFDLLTAEEASDRSNVFDVPLLAGRLISATRWAREAPESCGLSFGYFGASTGASAALWAAAELCGEIDAVVSRGGRPDLAAPRLGDLDAPTLFIVGGNDLQVLELNRRAAELIRCPQELTIVPGATHLFEEPGALDRVSELAIEWFKQNLKEPELEPD